MQFKTSVLK